MRPPPGARIFVASSGGGQKYALKQGVSAGIIASEFNRLKKPRTCTANRANVLKSPKIKVFSMCFAEFLKTGICRKSCASSYVEMSIAGECRKWFTVCGLGDGGVGRGMT